VTLKPNTVYGFDINGGTDRHYWQWDGTTQNAYPKGNAYSVRKGRLIERIGDHVFIVALTRATGTDPAKAANADEPASPRKLANSATAGDTK
jgi:hypothetical protein